MSRTHQADADIPVHEPRTPSRLRRGLAASACGLVLAGMLAACTRAPIALIAQTADGQITLSWTPVSQPACSTIDGYAVYQGTTPGGENYASPLNAQATAGGPITTTLSSYTVTNLTDAVTYYFTVKTVGTFFGQPCVSWTSVEIAATPGTDDDFFGCWQDQLCIVTRHLPSGDRGRTYAATLYADDGVPPYTWSLIGGRLPGSVVLNPDGLLIGTLGGHGLYVFYVQVEDSIGNTTAEELTIYVN